MHGERGCGGASCLLLCVPIRNRGFSGASDGKESACNAGDLGMIPGLGRSTGGGNSSPLQYSCLGNPWTEEPGRLLSMESQRLDMTERFHFHFRNGAWLLWHPLVSSRIPLVAAVPYSCPLRLSLHSQPQSSP